VNEALLRDLVPAVIGVVVRRGADFASAEDAVQEALVAAVRMWRRREVRIEGAPMPGPVHAGG